MEGKHFDALIKRLGTGAARRRVLGGMVGVTAAVLTGAAVLEAKPGKSKGKHKGQPKLSYCHQTGNGSYRFVTVGAPSGHRKHEGDILCTPPAPCQVATGCDDATAACTFGPAAEGTPCDIDPAIEEACDATGACVSVV